jgi:hypothetical protein
MKNDVNWRSELLRRLQEVRSNCKTCNQLRGKTEKGETGKTDYRYQERICRTIRSGCIGGVSNVDIDRNNALQIKGYRSRHLHVCYTTLCLCANLKKL